MEKNTKIIKIILIVLVAVICIYAIFVIRRYSILTKVGEMQEENLKKTNYHILVETISNNESEIISTEETWVKNNISKIEMKTTMNEDTINTFWCNSNKQENYEYSIVKGKKVYATSDIPEVLPNSIERALPISENNTWERLKYALNLFKKIKTEKNDGKKCYVFEGENYQKIYVDKETGVVVLKERKVKKSELANSQYNNEEYYVKERINCSFDIVSDEDVALPDFTDYELR